MAVKKSNFYLTREQLIREIVLSKQKQRLHPHKTPAECFTPDLTNYLRLMVNRYANKGQWRSYCVDQTTQALTYKGWLGIDEITTDDTILSYKDGQLVWSKIKSIYRGDYEGKLFHLTVQGFDALVTPGHKFLTTEGLKTVEKLRQQDRLILLGDGVASPPTENFYNDAFVELVGWVVTEGNYYNDQQRSYCRVTVFQNEGVRAERIRACLRELSAGFSEYGRENSNGKVNVAFHLQKELCDLLLKAVPNKIPTMDFILRLSQSQRQLLIYTMVQADGWITYEKYLNYGQCDKSHIDIFVALCTMAGYRTSVRLTDPVGYGKKPFYKVRIFSGNSRHSVVENIDFHGGKNCNRIIGKLKEHYPHEPTVDYKGRVWCPETEHGCFVARRNDCIYLTGNSYLDDMKSDALLTLCQNAFKYNEEKYDNPFGYYTQIIKYSFITFLEKEELIRDIKDSLWESIGMTPSYARQIKNEMMKDVADQSSKGMKAIKKDVELLNIKINALSSIATRLRRTIPPEADLDAEIAEALEIDALPYTTDLASALLLFAEPPNYIIERDIEIAGQLSDCLNVFDASTKSTTKRILANTNIETIVLALCSIGLAVRRDLLVKRVREVSGYNITTTHIPTAERMVPLQNDVEFGDEPRLTMQDFITTSTPRRKGRKKNAD